MTDLLKYPTTQKRMWPPDTSGFFRPIPDDWPSACRCPLTRGASMYEAWLWKQGIPPDDLWDYVPEHERLAWEALAVDVGWQG